MFSRNLLTAMAAAIVACVCARTGAAQRAQTEVGKNPVEYVNPLIGSASGGKTFPGAVVPFGMVQWSPETTRGNATRTAAPGGYAYDATRIRGFSLTHLSGTGCRGASGDIPFMPYVGQLKSAPSADANVRSRSTRTSDRASPTEEITSAAGGTITW